MNFATWSIRNPIPSILLFMLLTLAGVVGFRALPIQNFPDMDLPMVNIRLSSAGGGADPARDRGRAQGRGFTGDSSWC